MLARKRFGLSVWHPGLRVLEKEGRGENLPIQMFALINSNPNQSVPQDTTT